MGSEVMRRAQIPFALLLLAACATDRPTGTSFDSSAGELVVDVCGDGFVRTGERRLPLDALILEMRQAARSMSLDQRGRYVVHLRIAKDVTTGAQAKIANDGLNRLVDELQIMEMLQVKFL